MTFDESSACFGTIDSSMHHGWRERHSISMRFCLGNDQRILSSSIAVLTSTIAMIQNLTTTCVSVQPPRWKW